MKRYRIVTEENKIKFAGTGLESWFTSVEDARLNADSVLGDMIYEYNEAGEKLWEVM